MKIKVDLARMISHAPSETMSFSIAYPTYIGNVTQSFESLVAVEFTRTTSTVSAIVFIRGQSTTLTGNDVADLSATGDYIVFEGNWTLGSGTTFEKLLDLGYISYDVDGKTALITYLQNSENGKLDKTIAEVGTILGTFNQAIGLKSIDVDITGYARDFNYVWIPTLRRYYYVDSVDLISADVTRLHLKEDVLMSWKSLIRSQTAFIERQENVYDNDLIDELVKYSYDKSVLSFAVTLSNDIFANTDNDDLDFVVETVG